MSGKNFGYAINKGRVIDLDKNVSDFGKHIAEYDATYNLCIGCGACTATCTTCKLTDFNVRKLNALLRRGETTGLDEEISKCMFCGKCQLVCPRGVNTRNIILTINKTLKKAVI